MKKILFLSAVIAVLIAWLVIGVVGKQTDSALFKPSAPAPQETEQRLIEGFEQAARQINQNLPTMVDEQTRMDKATVGPGARITYHYTLPKYTSQDIDSAQLRQNLQPAVTNSVCNNKEMKPSLQYGGIYAYAYNGSDGNPIGAFEIDRDDCGFSAIAP